MTKQTIFLGFVIGLGLLILPQTGCDSGEGGEASFCPSGAALYTYSLSDWREVFCRMDGLAHGPYTRELLDGGLLISGAFDQGRSDGEWLYYHQAAGDLLSKRAFYVLDVPHGDWFEYSIEGMIQKEQHFDMGVACGIWREYDGDGAVFSEVVYLGCDGEVIGNEPPEGLTLAPKDVDPGWAGLSCPAGTLVKDDEQDPGARWCVDGSGQRDGPYGRWTTEGRKLTGGLYADGMRTGVWTTWNEEASLWEEEGPVIRQETWNADALDGPWWSWAASGMPQEAGTYTGGQRSGVWTGWYPHGKRSWEGAYQAGEKSGAWTEWWSDGITREESTWAAGLLHGAYALNYADGKRSMEGSYADDRETGTWTSYWPNGLVWSEGEYEHGWRQGMWHWWKVDGRPYMEGAYVDQNPIGEWAIYLTDHVLGALIRFAGPYDGAVRRGLWVGTWVDAGTPESEQFYIDNLMEGLYTAWWPDGTKRVEGTYLTSLAEYTWMFWYQNGQLMAECDFHQGQLNGPYTEWYDTGVKKSEGGYSSGGEWSGTSWDEDGEEIPGESDGGGDPR